MRYQHPIFEVEIEVEVEVEIKKNNFQPYG